MEIFNRSSNTVDLTGWRLDEGIDYRFDDGKTLAPGGYLVIAKDVTFMQSLYPGLDVVGPFTNRLSQDSDYFVLKDPNNNLADEVRYFGGGRWHEYADGGGSSLELRDPWADNAVPEAWDRQRRARKVAMADVHVAWRFGAGPDGRANHCGASSRFACSTARARCWWTMSV